MKKIIFILITFVVVFVLVGLAGFVVAFSEGETRRGTLAYYLHIPKIIAQFPEIGSVYNVRFSYGFYDNGNPQNEAILYCTDASREEILSSLDKYLSENGLEKKNDDVWVFPVAENVSAEIEMRYEEDAGTCQKKNSLIISKLSWPAE